MIRNSDELILAMVAFIKFHDSKTKDIEAWRKFCETDPQSKYLKRLFQFYHKKLKHAEKFGFVGVGCITFAENRMQTFQRKIAAQLKPT